MAKKIQIIGKVTGLDRAHCEAKFKDTQELLEFRGYDVVNPVTLVPEHATWDQAMRLCILELLTVDAVFVQPDWYDSKGARVEYMIANALHLQMIHV